MLDHRLDPSANALAHGPAKTEDIENVRHDLDRAEQGTVARLHAAAERQEQKVADREDSRRRSEP
jgi:hypothetical protein